MNLAPLARSRRVPEELLQCPTLSLPFQSLGSLLAQRWLKFCNSLSECPKGRCAQSDRPRSIGLLHQPTFALIPHPSPSEEGCQNSKFPKFRVSPEGEGFGVGQPAIDKSELLPSNLYPIVGTAGADADPIKVGVIPSLISLQGRHVLEFLTKLVKPPGSENPCFPRCHNARPLEYCHYGRQVELIGLN